MPRRRSRHRDRLELVCADVLDLANGISIKALGRVEYARTADAMRAFTEARDDRHRRRDLAVRARAGVHAGMAGRAEHVLDAGDIPVLRSNRGGQVTYHGPGQVVAYPLVDLRRLGITSRSTCSASKQRC